ncbi:hypothetical protein Forpe1208_v012037 [Fusarium oxysporum f. sp. rapae]|uniref:Uncharacterized protein n=1 Tax=Fusarium oxysporum f. sp. rapae TaxID=485398 RepID=A0A8J5NRM2_FUSOX|nr:hypothetical protein Forpe1208_v012037 [Fusarium oxysporum f. sp. rapae]
MVHETSAHLIDEQKKMFERPWKAMMGSQQKAAQMIGEQLEMIRQLQQEVWAVKVQATEESRKADELRRLHEQSTRQLRVMREQMNEQIKTIREQPAKELEQLREEMKQVKEDTKQAKEATLLAKELAKVQVQTTEEMKQVKEE